MARPQEVNNGQRQVINTIEDTSKYQTGDARRLRVIADPLRILETPADTQLTQLTQALGTVKPQLMDWAVNREAEAYKTSIELGKRKAQTGGVAQGEMEQYGYDNIKAVNDWTDWNQQVLTEYEQKFDKENGNLEEFMKAKWEANPFADKSENYVNKFTPLAGKTMEKLRLTQGQFKADLQTSKNNVELTRMFKADINDVMGSGQNYGVAQYEARRDKLKAMFPGKTNSQLDELAYMAVLETMEVSGDTTLKDVFKQPHSDGTPGLYEIPKWKDKIDADVTAIITKKNADRTKTEAQNEKALKVAADTKEREIMFKLIDVSNFEDPTVRAEKLRELIAETEGISKMGIPLSDGILGKLMTSYTSIDKKQETAYQAQKYATLRLGNPSNQEIAKALISGDISQAGFDKLMNKKDAATLRAERGGGAEKSITTNSFYKDGEKAIKQVMGFATGINAAINPKRVTEQTNAALADYKDLVEDLQDEGLTPREASEKAKEATVKKIKEAGIQSKEFEEANRKLDPVAAKRSDPVSYYKSNPQEFATDIRNKTLPTNITQKDLKELQSKAKAQAEANKRLKKHESTK
ncbi:MAG: hypothetical protein B7X95_09260 [Methylophilaceae bacterium 17-44-8]|nr:MAG: hypothetical protein B7X95_09260 [Methylophilaceae bacterium 17-44-8]